MAAFDSEPVKTVTLAKTTDFSGDLPLGSTYTWTYKSNLLSSTALARARQAFARDNPDEKPVNWKVQSEPE